MSNFPTTLKEVQASLATDDAGDILDTAFLADETNTLALLNSFANGFRLAPDRVDRITHWRQIQQAVNKTWAGIEPFLDDATFSGEKLMLITSAWWEPVNVVPSEITAAAAAQIIRMFHAGRLLPEYAALFIGLQLVQDDLEFQANIYTHDTAAESRARETLPALLTSDPHSMIPAELIRAEELRSELFRTHWLPTLISPSEYAQVIHLPTKLLVSLFPKEWDGGYDLYYAHQMGLIDAADTWEI